MKKQLIASLLLSVSFAFAQYGESDYNSYGGSAWGSQDSGQDNSSNEGNVQYSVQDYSSTSQKSRDKSDRYTHAHRGFYFVNALTIGYTYLRGSEQDYYNHRAEFENYKFKGVAIPYEEVRLGASIANTVSIYAALGLGYATGSINFTRGDISTSVQTENFKASAATLKFLLGLGLEFYPIHDQDNPAYGLFFGVCSGFSIEGAFYEKEERSSSYYHDYETSQEDRVFPAIYARFEVGKDWWFCRRWSVGISFNYTIGSLEDKVHSDDSFNMDRDSFAVHSFGLTVRIAH